MSSAADLLKAFKPPADWLRSLYTDAIAQGVKVTSWVKGAPTRALYYGTARALSTLSSAVQDIANQGFRSTAAGDALTLNAAQVFGIKRGAASYATTTVLISNAGGGNYPFEARELVLLATTQQKQYVNLAPVTIGPLAVDVPVDVVAIEAGSASSALPSDIDAFVTALDGLSISQPNAALATDQQSDEEVQALCAARLGFVPTAVTIGAGGAPTAFESIAKLGPDGGGGVLREDGTRIKVSRCRVINDGAGGVSVVVADEDGAIAGPDLALVDAAVLAYGTSIGLVSAEAVNAGDEAIAITMSIAVGESSATLDADIEDAATAGIVEFFSRVPIGGYEVNSVDMIPLELIAAAVRDAVEAVAVPVIKIAITVPAADVTTIATDEVPSLSGTPTITITRVPGL